MRQSRRREKVGPMSHRLALKLDICRAQRRHPNLMSGACCCLQLYDATLRRRRRLESDVWQSVCSLYELIIAALTNTLHVACRQIVDAEGSVRLPQYAPTVGQRTEIRGTPYSRITPWLRKSRLNPNAYQRHAQEYKSLIPFPMPQSISGRLTHLPLPS